MPFFLLENKADINHKNNDGYTALDFALHFNNESIITLLKTRQIQLFTIENYENKIFKTENEFYSY